MIEMKVGRATHFVTVAEHLRILHHSLRNKALTPFVHPNRYEWVDTYLELPPEGMVSPYRDPYLCVPVTNRAA